MRRCSWAVSVNEPPFEGWFHCFVTETNYHTGNQYAAAVVETLDGTVYVVEATFVTFLEPYDPQKELNEWRHKKRS